jgi:hypothetical protein
MSSFFKAHDEDDLRVYRCQCGVLYSDRAFSDSKFMKNHDGHSLQVATGGTVWEFIKLKMGWIK